MSGDSWVRAVVWKLEPPQENALLALQGKRSEVQYAARLRTEKLDVELQGTREKERWTAEEYLIVPVLLKCDSRTNPLHGMLT